MTLAARDLAFGFAGHRVGSDIDFEFPTGEVVCLLGPNGSGKTTLMRTLLGLVPALSGRVMLDGRPLMEWPTLERASRLAYVPQATETHFDFNVLEMVEMGRTAHRGLFGTPGRADRAMAAACLERLHIGALAKRPIHRVSGGERQLALIARALATEAAHLLMDEPTANLDFGNQALILDEVARLRHAGKAILFSTHHPDHALRIADRVVMLRGGRLLAAGPAAQVLDSENLSALYGRDIVVAEVVLPGGIRRRTCMAREAPDRLT